LALDWQRAREAVLRKRAARYESKRKAVTDLQRDGDHDMDTVQLLQSLPTADRPVEEDRPVDKRSVEDAMDVTVLSVTAFAIGTRQTGRARSHVVCTGDSVGRLRVFHFDPSQDGQNAQRFRLVHENREHGRPILQLKHVLLQVSYAIT